MSTLKNLPLWDHVDELRSRLVKCVAALFIATVLSYGFIEHLLVFILKPVGSLVFTAPADAFVARIMLSFCFGFLFSFPIILYQVWQFVAVGLHEKEQKIVRIYIPISIGLFLIGASFSYFIVIPISLNFLLGFASPSMIPMITIKSYISFITTMILAFGAIFEMPLILLFLTKIGIATPEFLIQKRKHAIVLVFILSALITPPDVFTQVLMAIPLVVLYEIGIIASRMSYKGKI